MMKSFSLFAAAAFLALGSTAHADPSARPTAAQPNASYLPGYAVPVATSADIDFPDYPAGFSSYRGLGFLGSCCTPCPTAAQRAWAGYCDEQSCCEGQVCAEAAPCASFFGKFHGWLHRPAWSGVTKSGDSCGSPGANWWPVAPPCHEPLCFKLQRLRAQWAGGGVSCGEPCVAGGKSPEGAKGQTPKSAESVPEPPVPDAPAPQATGGVRPNLPSPPTMDRSARRLSPRRLPSPTDF